MLLAEHVTTRVPPEMFNVPEVRPKGQGRPEISGNCCRLKLLQLLQVAAPLHLSLPPLAGAQVAKGRLRLTADDTRHW